MPTRVGAVAYLNARPLVHGLEQDAVQGLLQLEYEVPSQLTPRMRSGELDIALIPIIGLTEMPDLELVSGIAIGTRGESRSVLLISRRPLDQIRTLALDPESRTSNILAQVLLAKRHDVQPEAEIGPLNLEQALERYDAVVRIGDKALFEPRPASAVVMDLGTEWTAWTGLPFVFAAWFARPGVLTRETYRRLHNSRRQGIAAIDQIAANYRWEGHADPQLAAHYLRNHIHHRLGSAEVEAIKLFFDVAHELHLIEQSPEIRFALQRTTQCHETAARLASES